MNILKTGSGGYVEIQGSAEKEPFNDKQMASLLSLADKGIKELIVMQKTVLGELL
jgi:ribonuclease PH